MRRGGHTKAYVWMWDNYDRMLAAGPMSWRTVASELNRLGMTGRKGPLRSEAARMTWKRVKEDKAAEVKVGSAPAEVAPRQSRGPFFGPDSPVTPIEPDDGDGFKLKRG